MRSRRRCETNMPNFGSGLYDKHTIEGKTAKEQVGSILAAIGIWQKKHAGACLVWLHPDLTEAGLYLLSGTQRQHINVAYDRRCMPVLSCFLEEVEEE